MEKWCKSRMKGNKNLVSNPHGHPVVQSCPFSGANRVRADQDVQGVRRQARPVRRDRQDTVVAQQARVAGRLFRG